MMVPAQCFLFCGQVRDLPLLFQGYPPDMTLLEYLRLSQGCSHDVAPGP